MIQEWYRNVTVKYRIVPAQCEGSFSDFCTVIIQLFTALSFLFDDHSILNGQNWIFCNDPREQGDREVQLCFSILSLNSYEEKFQYESMSVYLGQNLNKKSAIQRNLFLILFLIFYIMRVISLMWHQRRGSVFTLLWLLYRNLLHSMKKTSTEWNWFYLSNFFFLRFSIQNF